MILSIIIVNANGWHDLRPCLQSVLEQTKGFEYEIIVVDNASTDGSREGLKSLFPQVKLISNSENIGFAAANNRGIAQASGNYILLLNPDTIIQDATITKTVQYMKEHPFVGIAGCKLLFPDGSLQYSVRSFPSVWNVFCEVTFLHRLFPKTKLFGKYYLAYFDYQSESQVDWVSGAYMMIRKEVIDHIGLLDEQFFMYSEEVDFCYRAKAAGFQVWYSPQAEVIHYWGGMNATNRRVVLWTNGSQLLYFQKHFYGIKKYILIGLKLFGLMVIALSNIIIGCLVMKKKNFIKAYYFIFTLYKLVAAPWKYRYNFSGKVVPWENV